MSTYMHYSVWFKKMYKCWILEIEFWTRQYPVVSLVVRVKDIGGSVNTNVINIWNSKWWELLLKYKHNNQFRFSVRVLSRTFCLHRVSQNFSNQTLLPSTLDRMVYLWRWYSTPGILYRYYYMLTIWILDHIHDICIFVESAYKA